MKKPFAVPNDNEKMLASHRWEDLPKGILRIFRLHQRRRHT